MSTLLARTSTRSVAALLGSVTVPAIAPVTIDWAVAVALRHITRRPAIASPDGRDVRTPDMWFASGVATATRVPVFLCPEPPHALTGGRVRTAASSNQTRNTALHTTLGSTIAIEVPNRPST